MCAPPVPFSEHAGGFEAPKGGATRNVPSDPCTPLSRTNTQDSRTNECIPCLCVFHARIWHAINYCCEAFFGLCFVGYADALAADVMCASVRELGLLHCTHYSQPTRPRTSPSGRRARRPRPTTRRRCPPGFRHHHHRWHRSIVVCARTIRIVRV